ncbi:hypothetical protein ACJ73_08036 [Blastomyces percursus]|uniref:Uncharacterized protein n=1 Tax=Blastomyces percursus TaxID=1658174 RepID=A0A1J9PWA2_9EURO|nr:hypothetical protein ACJ73_08036 [Blastomyces percursus]
MDVHLVPGGGRRNYTGFVTKTIVYAATLLVFLTSMYFARVYYFFSRRIFLFGYQTNKNNHHSIRLDTGVNSPAAMDQFSERNDSLMQSTGVSYGLHYRCFSTTTPNTTTTTTTCVRFPQFDDCTGDDRQFCSMWRSVGFLMSFAVVLEGMTLITYIIILAGGKQMRESGWRILSMLLLLVALVQCASMGLVSYLNDNDDHFYLGFRLDDSFIMCTISWCLALLTAATIIFAARVLPSEGGYELIAEQPDS